MQFCGEPGCSALVPSGRCATHAPRDRAQRPGYTDVHRWYSSQAWQRLRLAVLQDEPFCRSCRAAGLNVLTTDIDHIVKHDGHAARFWDRSNLQGLCRPCHTRKTTRGD